MVCCLVKKKDKLAIILKVEQEDLYKNQIEKERVSKQKNHTKELKTEANWI